MACPPTRPGAFAPDARLQRLLSAAKAAWWSANYAAGKALVRRSVQVSSFSSDTPPPPKGWLRQAWLEAFRKDAADVAAGLYPVTERPPADAVRPLSRALDLLRDAQTVEARRRRGGVTEARGEEVSQAYPIYYRQNFHFQSGGWFTRDSAQRYEAQVEALFSGAAGAMRRRALSLLARTWRARDHRGLAVLDLACGSGAFLSDLSATFPRAWIVGLDLSAAYLDEARARSGRPGVQANAERLPFADASLDAVTCVFLFHELPPRVRPVVASEIARVLKPGGVLAFADALQATDEPALARPLEAFPAFFHEPYFASYQETNLSALFGAAGLKLRDSDRAFLTKALLFEKLAAP